MKKRNANSLTRDCIYLLKSQNIKSWRNNNTPIFDITRASKSLSGKVMPSDYRLVRNMLRKFFRSFNSEYGVSDIIGFDLNDATFYGIEVKYGRDKLSISQKDFLNKINNSGGFGYDYNGDSDKLLEDLKLFKQKK